jgi:hypothetical protein
MRGERWEKGEVRWGEIRYSCPAKVGLQVPNLGSGRGRF